MTASPCAHTLTQGFRDHKEGNITLPKDHAILIVTDPKEMEIRELLNKIQHNYFKDAWKITVEHRTPI